MGICPSGMGICSAGMGAFGMGWSLYTCSGFGVDNVHMSEYKYRAGKCVRMYVRM